MRERHRAAVSAWRLHDVRPLPGGCVALVCATDRGILKLNPRGHRDSDQLGGEGSALAFWEPTGVVPRLLGQRDDGFTLLIERLEPGTALDDEPLAWEKRLELLGDLAATLHGRGTPSDEFISMRDFCADWRRGLAGEPELLAELERLVAPAADDVLLHADLHGGNALLDGTRWKVIDPKGVRGDRHADTWALLDPVAPPLPDSPGAAAAEARSRVARYAAAAGLDAERAAAWTRVRAVAEASWVTDAEWAARLRALAAALA